MEYLKINWGTGYMYLCVREFFPIAESPEDCADD